MRRRCLSRRWREPPPASVPPAPFVRLPHDEPAGHGKARRLHLHISTKRCQSPITRAALLVIKHSTTQHLSELKNLARYCKAQYSKPATLALLAVLFNLPLLNAKRGMVFACLSKETFFPDTQRLGLQHKLLACEARARHSCICRQIYTVLYSTATQFSSRKRTVVTSVA